MNYYCQNFQRNNIIKGEESVQLFYHNAARQKIDIQFFPIILIFRIRSKILEEPTATSG